MREIKFRVWSDFWEKYADFDVALYMDGSVEADFTDGTGIPHHETTDLVVEQYTGLKDKNGTATITTAAYGRLLRAKVHGCRN